MFRLPRPSMKTASPRPGFKLSTLRTAVGKTIVGVEFGEQEMSKSCHQAEAIILHFDDGNSMSFTIGSNAGNLEGSTKNLKASDFSTDIMVHLLQVESSGHPGQKNETDEKFEDENINL
jgi:hypothetical protein